LLLLLLLLDMHAAAAGYMHASAVGYLHAAHSLLLLLLV
jgi:hypothetical protein